MASGYVHTNLDDVEDQAPKFGIESQSSRFVRTNVGAEGIGMAHYVVKPGQTFDFAHRHKTMEEMYVVLSGSGRFRLDDDVVEVKPRDVIYCAPRTWRGWAGGPDGLELLAFGSHAEGDDESEMRKDFAVE
jgi:quercetin dioxygenase-like cupin family protein